MNGPIRIDAHQHFWDIESGRYTWPTPEDGAIFRTYSPADLEPELGPAGIDASRPRAVQRRWFLGPKQHAALGTPGHRPSGSLLPA